MPRLDRAELHSSANLEAYACICSFPNNIPLSIEKKFPSHSIFTKDQLHTSQHVLPLRRPTPALLSGENCRGRNRSRNGLGHVQQVPTQPRAPTIYLVDLIRIHSNTDPPCTGYPNPARRNASPPNTATRTSTRARACAWIDA